MKDIKSGRSRLAGIVAGATLSAVSLLGASLARASTTITRQRGTKIVSWSIETSTSDSVSIDDATLSNTAIGSTRGDAFDGAFNVYLFPSSDTSSNSTLREEATLDAAATVVNNSPNGGTVSGTASATVAGQDIGVDFNLVFSSSAAKVDGTFIIRNNSGTPFTGFVGIYTNFGSDSSTVVEATSSGDTVLDGADSWVISSEGSGEAAGDDPIILSATGPGAVPGPGSDLDGNDDLIWRTTITNLAPGATITVSASHELFETIAAANAAAQPEKVPVMSNPALLALAVLTGLLGAGNLVSRRDKKKV